MPGVGEIRKASEVGKSSYISDEYIWQSCPKCNMARWVAIKYSLNQKGEVPICMKCHRERTSLKAKIKCEQLAHKLNIKVEKEKCPRRSRGKTYAGYRGEEYQPLVHELKVKAKWTCSKCGWKAKRRQEHSAILVHHKNRNPLDNTSSNLEVLCDTCHNKLQRNWGWGS